MKSPLLSAFCLLLSFSLPALESFPADGMAATDHELVIPIEVQSTSASPAGITFKIHKTTYALDVYRKNPASTLWGTVRTTIPAGSATWTDITAVVGTAYEYRFHAKNVPSVAWVDDGYTLAADHNLYANTYVLAGIHVDTTGSRGHVILVMPTSIQTPLAAEILRFKQDLVGDGWAVHDVLTPDGRNDWTDPVDGFHTQIRNDIIAIYNTYPGEVKHVILLGRVPQPRSGLRAAWASDGHSDLGANAADCYYADVNNTWTDTGEITVPTANASGSVRAEWRNVPGDGRFDQTHFRSHTEAFEMGWGRIDFRGAVNGGDEINALRNYLNKLHDYKHAQNGFKPGRRSIMMDGGALYKHVQEEFFRNIPQLSGLENIERITYADMPSVAWQPEAQYTFDNGPYLYAFTAGNEPNKDSNMSRAVFWTAAKSSVSYWDITSWMRERIAEPDSWTLSWTTSPARGRYVYHKMGLGGSIGDMMKATINNRDNETGLHGSAVRNYINGAWTVQNPVGATQDYSGFVFNGHMGDPTLRDQMIESPAWVRGRLQNGGAQVQVEWLASPDATQGYDLYSGTSLTGGFSKRNASPLHVNATTGTLSWTDTAPPSDPIVYMVRARKLEQTPSGSFYNASVGRMVEVDRSPSAFAMASPALPTAYLASEYEFQLQTTGGNPPETWTILSGTLPSGLSLSASGRITGTPTNAGSFPLNLRATDLQGTVQEAARTLVVDMFHTWTLLPNGNLQSTPTYSGSFNQTTVNNWIHTADPNSQWTYDSTNKWSQTFRTGRTGAQPGIGYVIPDLKAKQGAVAFRFDVKNTDGSGTPNRLDYRFYGINGSFSWDFWNYGSNPTGAATLLQLGSVAGNVDWTAFETPALPVGNGYDYYVLRFMPSNVDSDLGDFMAIDNLRWSTAQAPPAFYTVTFSAGANGTLLGDLNQSVVEGGNATTVTAVPANGYELFNWTWSGASSTANPLTLTNVASPLAVTANFQLFNNPPTAAITAPNQGSAFQQDASIPFSGTGNDSEDGTISSATWSSSIDGVFMPVGGVFSQLSAGTHTITRSVTDSGGKTASASVTITVTPTSIFTQRFGSSSAVADYIGSAPHLFDYIGTDTTANNRASLSVTLGRLRNTIAYTDEGNSAQLSASRSTRQTNLPVESNFAVVSATVRLAPQNWPSADTNFLGFTIGQNFRSGIFTPSTGTGNGPAFASFTVQARATANTFRSTGAGGNSANFSVTPSGGVYELALVVAANAGPTEQTFPSPTGPHSVQPGRLSLWINGALHLNNTATGITAANLEDFSFSTGSGTASSYAAGSVFNGYYELDDVVVKTFSSFSTPPPPPVPAGYVSVLDFGADPSGLTDSTASLQSAINHGIANQSVVWFPAGEYRISARLIANQPDDDPDFPAVLMGSTVNPAQRATLVLAANAAGFNDPNARRAMLHFFNRGTADNESGENTLYNQAVIGLDFRVEAGNAGAVALRMQGAEGCTLQDLNIDLRTGGHTGIWGVPGSGGTTHQVSVTGGVIGIDTRTQSLGGGGSQPTVTITGSTFVDQSDLALWSSTRGAMVLVGVAISRGTPGPVLRLQRNYAEQPFDGNLQWVDSSVAYASHHASNTVIDMPAGAGRSFYMDNVFVQNGERVWTAVAPANPSGWMRFARLAVEVRPGNQSWGQPLEQLWRNGVPQTGLLLESTSGVAPPSDLQSRHRWATSFPTWESPGAVNVRNLGAVGDGVTDDHAALQAAINAHDIVFLPKGHYRVSNTLTLRPQNKLIGVHHNFSVIEALSSLTHRFANTDEAAGDRPIVSTADAADADTVIAFLHLKRHYPLAQHNPTPVGNYALEWRSGGNSVLRGVRLESRADTNLRPDFVASSFYGIGGGINPNYPQDDFGAGQWAWPGSEPTVQVRGNGGGRWFGFWVHGRQALRSHVPFLRVQGTRQPLHLYHLHLQQQDSVNHAEFIDVENISVYGTKSELKGTLLYFENARHVRVFGSGGLASPDPNRPNPYLFRFVDCDDFQISGFAETVNPGTSLWIGGEYDRWIHANILGWSPLQDTHSGRSDVIVPSLHRPLLYLRVSDGYTRWALDNGIAGAATDTIDGVPNLLRYALGGTAATPASTFRLLPTRSGTGLTLNFPRIDDAALIYEVWAADQLPDWAKVWEGQGAGLGEVQIPATGNLLFLHLRVRRE